LAGSGLVETRLSVLHFEAGKHWTGGPVQVLNLHRSLCERGVASVLVAPSDSAILQRAKAQKLPVAEIPYAGEADLLAPVRLARLIRQYRPSIVHLHSRRGAPLTGELAVRLAGRPRPKVVIHRRVDNVPSRNWITRWEFGGGCHHIIAISNKIYGVLRDYGVPEDKLSLIYSSVDLEAFPTPYSRQEVLDLLELPSSCLIHI
jgi:glycosyltransferase involved in cell wall biosynthesis